MKGRDQWHWTNTKDPLQLQHPWSDQGNVYGYRPPEGEGLGWQGKLIITAGITFWVGILVVPPIISIILGAYN